MRRGELWTVQGESFASKPRPLLVIQSDEVDSFDSTVLCLITTHDSEVIPTRVALSSADKNGLRENSWVMTDKIYSARNTGQAIGREYSDDCSLLQNLAKQYACIY